MPLTLPAGTVLDGRYRIVRVIRLGGFGITYEAVHMQSGGEVAVKEYFCREICVRLPETSSAADPEMIGRASAARSVAVADPADLPRFEADRARFLREARILREFAQESAVVTVLDYFEENGTAYIVMEYLEARTLREEIHYSGTWGMEQAVGRFRPLMEALGRIHAAGMLHRDISPDNIMVMEDGALRLIDFGASRSLQGLSSRHSAIYTAGYSAPEQRDSRGKLGSWTDVYGLCGVMCFCLTGRDPEDALSRLLFDELERPSASGADIMPRAEQVLMQGLALDADKRIPDMQQLMEELQKYYPLLTDMEKERKREQRRRKLRRTGAAAACLLVCIGLVCAAFRTQIRFRFIETQVTALDGSDMPAEEFAVNAEAVKKRVEAFAGKGNYLWREKEGQQILIELPSGLYGSADPRQYAVGMLAGRNLIRIYVEEWKKEDAGAPDTAVEELTREEKGNQNSQSGLDAQDAGNGARNEEQDAGNGLENQDKASWTELYEGEDAPYQTEAGFQRSGLYRLGLFDQEGDVESVRITEEGRELVFTEKGRRRFQGALEDAGRKVLISFDEGSEGYSYDEGVITGDGRSIRMLGADPETSLTLLPRTKELDVLRYREKPLSASFGVECAWKTRWEEAGSSLLPGENQVNAEDVPAPYIDLSYLKAGDIIPSRDLPKQRGYDVTLVGIQAIFKNRLDGMGLPYAIGIDQYAPSRLVVRLPVEGLCREDVEKLGSYFFFRIGDAETFSDTSLIDCTLELEEKADGNPSLALVIPRLWNTEGIQEILTRIGERKEEKVFLYAMNRAIASADLADASRSLEQESRICFTDWPFQEDPPMESPALEKKTLPLLGFLSVCIEQNPDNSFLLEDMQFTEGDGIAYFRDNVLPAMYPDPGVQWAQQWNAEHKDSFVRYDEGEKDLYVSLFDQRLDDPASVLEMLWSVFREAREAGMPLQGIIGSLYERGPDDPLRYDGRYMSVQFKRDFESGGMQLYKGDPEGFEDEETVREICEIFNSYVRESPPWKDMLTGYYGDAPFDPSD